LGIYFYRRILISINIKTYLIGGIFIMKKLLKKALVLFTVLSIGVVGLTACGNKNNDSGSTTSSSSAN